MFLFVDKDILSENALFGKNKCITSNFCQAVNQNKANEEESVISPNHTNVELLKRLMSMYSQKRPAYNQFNMNFTKYKEDNSCNISLLQNKLNKNKPSIVPNTNILMCFSPSPMRSHKLRMDAHQKRKEILTKMISDDEIELIKETIQHNYKKL